MVCQVNTIIINALPLFVIGDKLSEHRINIKLLVKLEKNNIGIYKILQQTLHKMNNWQTTGFVMG
jgi:hypothetical protein